MSLCVLLSFAAACSQESTQPAAKGITACSETQPGVVVKKFPRQLSPQAKKAVLRARPGDWIKGTLLLDAKASPEDLTESLLALGAKPGAWSDTTHQMTVELPVSCLESVVELPEVMYFEAASVYSDSAD